MAASDQSFERLHRGTALLFEMIEIGDVNGDQSVERRAIRTPYPG